MATQQDLNRTDSPTQGSTFILNNTSYAGCDIKVVINIYDGGRSTTGQIATLNAEVKTIESDIRKANEALGPAITNVARWKPNTSEVRIASVEAKTLLEFIRVKQDTLISLQNRISDLEQKKSTAQGVTLAEVQTLSVSTARDKVAVRACGSVYPRGFCRGQREIAGSMVFTVFNEHVLYQIMDAHPTDFDAVAFTSVLMDQLPPIDITVSFANEYGAVSRMGIYGVEFMNEGQVMSIEDLLTENTVNYVARDIDPMRSVSQRSVDEASQLMANENALRASSLLLEDDYQQYKNALSPYSAFNRRRNPFL